MSTATQAVLLQCNDLGVSGGGCVRWKEQPPQMSVDYTQDTGCACGGYLESSKYSCAKAR